MTRITRSGFPESWSLLGIISRIARWIKKIQNYQKNQKVIMEGKSWMVKADEEAVEFLKLITLEDVLGPSAIDNTLWMANNITHLNMFRFGVQIPVPREKRKGRFVDVFENFYLE